MNKHLMPKEMSTYNCAKCTSTPGDDSSFTRNTMEKIRIRLQNALVPSEFKQALGSVISKPLTSLVPPKTFGNLECDCPAEPTSPETANFTKPMGPSQRSVRANKSLILTETMVNMDDLDHPVPGLQPFEGRPLSALVTNTLFLESMVLKPRLKFLCKDEVFEFFQETEDGTEDETKRLPNNCCVKKIRLKVLIPGLSYRGFTEKGEVTLTGKKIKSNVIPLGKIGTLRVDVPVQYFTINLYEGKANETDVPIFSASFNCDNLKPGIFEGDLPKSPDTTKPRGRKVLEIVDFELERPCPVKQGQVEVVNGAITGGDNFPTPDGRTSSGVNFQMSVDYTELNKAGCASACWTQYVQTVVELKKARKKKFKEVVGGSLHIDHTWIAPGPLWFCYPIQESTIKNGVLQKLIMRDYPHVKHANVVCGDKGPIPLKNGDTIRRRSIFYPQLICIDPPPFKVLASFTYTLTTDYVFNAGDLTKGGESRFSKINPYPHSGIPDDKEKAKLEDFLKNRKKRKSRCK